MDAADAVAHCPLLPASPNIARQPEVLERQIVQSLNRSNEKRSLESTISAIDCAGRRGPREGMKIVAWTESRSESGGLTWDIAGYSPWATKPAQ